MKTIGATKFKAICLSLLDEVNDTGDEYIITKHGKPVAKVTPYKKEKLKDFKSLKNSVKIKGDIISPLDEEDWGSLI
ncbi:MAG: type II toxin-antitoxin system Phd/YefM family antitoxin [Balneolales bacterium]